MAQGKAIQNSTSGPRRQDHQDSNNSPVAGSSPVPAAPDGGWGWVIVAAAFLQYVIADGAILSFGVLYVDLVDYFKQDRGKTAWISSLFTSIPMLAGPIASVLISRYGYRWVTIGGGITASLGFLLSTLAPSVEVLCLTMGIVTGLGLACTFVSAVVAVSFYFKQHRSLATGIATCGSGVGLFIFSPLTKALLDEYGWKGSTVITAGLFLNLCICGALLRPLESKRKRDAHVYSDKMKLHNGHSLNGVPEEVVPMNTSSNHSNNCDQMARRNATNLNKTQIHSHSFSEFLERSDSRPHPGQSLDIGEVYSRPLANGHLHHMEYVVARACSINKAFVGAPSRNGERVWTPLSREHDSDIDQQKPSVTAMTGTTSCPDLCAASCEIRSKEENPVKTLIREIRDAFRQNMNISVLKNPIYLIFWLSNFLLYMWYDTPYLFLTDQAHILGISDDNSALLLSIIGIVNTIGLLFYGYLGDLAKVNVVLMYAVSIVICGISVMLVPAMTDFYSLSIFSGVFGFLISANYALESIILVNLLGLEAFTNAYGLIYMGQGIANLVGPPIAGWLYDLTGSYKVSFIVSGFFIIISGMMLLLTPCVMKFQEKHQQQQQPQQTAQNGGKIKLWYRGGCVQDQDQQQQQQQQQLQPLYCTTEYETVI